MNHIIKIAVLVATIVSLPAMSWADSDDYNKSDKYNKADKHHKASSSSSSMVVRNDLYKNSCASCHFAYQPGLLPARSWDKLMQPKALEHHFGDNAELDEKDRQEVLSYLTANAADKSSHWLSRSMMRGIAANAAPIRISETRYFERKHDEVPSRMVKGNPQVKSWSNCAACHLGAAKGSFDEDSVRIPNYGYWED